MLGSPLPGWGAPGRTKEPGEPSSTRRRPSGWSQQHSGPNTPSQSLGGNPHVFSNYQGLHGSTGRAARPLAGRRQRAERAGRLSGLPHVDAAARAAPGLPEQRLCALPWGGGHRPLGCGRTELTLSVGLQETVKGPLAGRRRKCSANCKTLMEHGEAVISQQGTIIIIATNLVTKAS